MKRTMSTLIACVFAMSLAFALSGCQQLGIGAKAGKPELRDPQVSSPTIGQDGTLRVGVDTANAPFSTQVDNGKIVGIDVDIAAALANELGLKLELVDVGADAEGALNDGKVDVIMGRDKSDTATTCWLTDPYLQSSVALWATSTGVILPTAASNPQIEAQESSMSAWEVTNQFGEAALVPVPDLKTAFADLDNGTATLVASDIIIGSYVNHTAGYNAQVIGLMQTPGGYCVGVASANNDLKTVVANALKNLADGGQIQVVLKKWLGTSIDLDAYQYTEAASKAVGTGTATSTELGDVGSNAADINGTESTTEGEQTDQAGTEEGAATAGSNYVDYNAGVDYTQPVDNTGYIDYNTGYVANTGYVDYGTGYVDYGTGYDATGTGYVDYSATTL